MTGAAPRARTTRDGKPQIAEKVSLVLWQDLPVMETTSGHLSVRSLIIVIKSAFRG
jgi:hypothetical protein